MQQEPKTLEDLEFEILNWAFERRIFSDSDPKSLALKTVAEVGEYADNILKGRDCRDDIGDIVVTLILQCNMQDTNLLECLQIAFDEIKDRKGRMVDGTFVKAGDPALEVFAAE